MTKPRTSTRGPAPVPKAVLYRALSMIRGGALLREVARELGYSCELTISTWRKRYPWFADAMDEAKAEGREARWLAGGGPRVLARVRSGESQRAALAAEGLPNGAISHWTRSRPGFRAQLDAAMQAGHMRRCGARWARDKVAVLAWMERGRSVVEACRLVGCSDADVWRWRQDDPAFAADYARLIGPTGRARGRHKFRKLIALIHAGATVWDAAMLARIGMGPVGYWRDHFPELWAEIVAAYEATGRTPPRRRVA